MNPTDRFLDWLHTLVLMDDTVLLTMSRRKILEKVEVVWSFFREYGMVIKEAKAKVFVVHGKDGDAEPSCVDDITITPCLKYTYIEAPFTSDDSVSSALKVHEKMKISLAGCRFVVKRRVFDAALMSTPLYGCESW
ncbi:hypothetical protein E2C01_042206 [Portunus trituberculatus]|uniref:Reverse transcriptase domain-containing protein n=1 Tax=Portunus trituberculatus TaxID=210409 RepID=A0A5B7FTZ5_PORTR|nr:hypothetical protein [Portunus trituberculatus]